MKRIDARVAAALIAAEVVYFAVCLWLNAYGYLDRIVESFLGVS